MAGPRFLTLTTLVLTFGMADAQGAASGQISTARTNGVAVSVADAILFAGGYTDSLGKVKSDIVDMWNATSNTWTVHHMSTGRTLFAGTSLGSLAMFGCGETDSVKSETASADVFDADRGTWHVEYLSQARKKCSATSVVLQRDAAGRVLQGRIFFAGGWPLGGHAETDRVDIFDFASRTWSTASLSQPRMYGSAASVGPYAIFAGGLAATGNSAVVDIYDARSQTWSTSSLVKVQREGNAIGTQRHAIFYGAGHIQVFEPVSMTWKVLYHSAEWAKMACATVHNGRFALFAGGVGCPGNDCAVVEVYDEQEERWFMARRNLSMARQYLMGAGVGDVAVFAGGLNNSRNSTAATDFFTLEDLLTAPANYIHV